MGAMQHQEDGGAISLIATDTGLVIACNKGHYWQLDAACHTVPGVRRAVDERAHPISTEGATIELSKRLNLDLGSGLSKAFGLRED